MKVYESTIANKRDFKKVPQIKIKNSRLEKSGFIIGSEFNVTYENERIVLQLKKGEDNYDTGEKK